MQIIPGTKIGNVVNMMVMSGAKQVQYFHSPDLCLKVSRRTKPRKNEKTAEFVITIGRPNFEGRKFVKLCQKAKEPFPIKKTPIKWYNVKGKKPIETQDLCVNMDIEK